MIDGILFSYHTIIMVNEKASFDRLMYLLDQVVNRMNSAHSMPTDYDTGTPLYRAEIHTIQTIGHHPGINLSDLAQLMNVTKGAASQTVNKLTRKDLVRKARMSADNREVTLLLTDLGWKGYQSHENFHAQMYEMIRSYFGKGFAPKLKNYIKAISELNEVIDIVEKHYRY